MSPNSLEAQLVKYLTDAHSIEQQALAQLQGAPMIAGDPSIAEIFEQHLHETEGHARTVAELLTERNAQPSALKDAAGSITGVGFSAFAAAQPDTPGKLIAHAFAYEHMEEAAYHLLGPLAEQLGDAEVVTAVGEIERQEAAMAARLADQFDTAVDAGLRELGAEDLNEQILKYLTDAHAIELQSLKLLEKGTELAGVPALATIYAQHHEETDRHRRLIEAELDDRGAGPSKLKDAALRLGALNWNLFFRAQPDTPAKLAAFAYAYEHLEIASYELLQRVAARAGDNGTQALAHHIIGEETAATEKLWSLLDEALAASLQEQGLAMSH